MDDPEDTGQEREIVGPGKPPRQHQFKPGNPGRPKGARNRLGEQFLAALADDFDVHGKAAIETVRAERPQDYLKVVASILPKELNIKTDPLEELSDAELDRRIKQLAAALSLEIGTGETAGTETKPGSAEQAGGVSSIH
jgi:hypothetical protein